MNIYKLLNHYRTLGIRCIYPPARTSQVCMRARLKEDFYRYCRRKHRVKILHYGIFMPNRRSSDFVTKSMNYEVG